MIAIDKIPLGAIVNKALMLKSGQTHVRRYMRPLLERIEKGEIDPSFVITRTMSLDDAPKGYEIFQKKQDECIKIVLKPWRTASSSTTRRTAPEIGGSSSALL